LVSYCYTLEAVWTGQDCLVFRQLEQLRKGNIYLALVAIYWDHGQPFYLLCQRNWRMDRFIVAGIKRKNQWPNFAIWKMWPPCDVTRTKVAGEGWKQDY